MPQGELQPELHRQHEHLQNHGVRRELQFGLRRVSRLQLSLRYSPKLLDRPLTDNAHAPGPIIQHRLPDFLLGIHHKRPIARHRLAKRHTPQ